MEDSNIEPNNNQNDKENNSPKYYSFEISCEKELFSIEISTEEKEKSECIIFKAYEKSNVSKFIYSNRYDSKQCLEMSKAFKICDNFNEIFSMILLKFKDKEVSLTLKDDLHINLDFMLPNKKVEKISFILLKEKIKESELIEKLYENIGFLSKQNKALQEQIKQLSSKKEKTSMDIMSNKFKESKTVLLNELDSFLEKEYLEKDYKKEIMDKFQSKIKTIYNFKKDDDTIIEFISKVFGKNNLFGYISFYYPDEEKPFGADFVYLDGKLEFQNDCLTFLTNKIFSYGTFGVWGDKHNFDFFHFKNDNSKVHLKIEKGFVYFIFYKDENKICFTIKIIDHFAKNPILLGKVYFKYIEDVDNNLLNNKLIDMFESSYNNQIKDTKKNEVNNNEEKKEENNDLFAISKVYLKELKIYQIQNDD